MRLLLAGLLFLAGGAARAEITAIVVQPGGSSGQLQYQDANGDFAGAAGSSVSGASVTVGEMRASTGAFGAGAVKSTFAATGALNMAAGAAITLGGAGGYVASQSSINANQFFGDGSHLTGLPSSGTAVAFAAWQSTVSPVVARHEVWQSTMSPFAAQLDADLTQEVSDRMTGDAAQGVALATTATVLADAAQRAAVSATTGAAAGLYAVSTETVRAVAVEGMFAAWQSTASPDLAALLSFRGSTIAAADYGLRGSTLAAADWGLRASTLAAVDYGLRGSTLAAADYGLRGSTLAAADYGLRASTLAAVDYGLRGSTISTSGNAATVTNGAYANSNNHFSVHQAADAGITTTTGTFTGGDNSTYSINASSGIHSSKDIKADGVVQGAYVVGDGSRLSNLPTGSGQIWATTCAVITANLVVSAGNTGVAYSTVSASITAGDVDLQFTGEAYNSTNGYSCYAYLMWDGVIKTFIRMTSAVAGDPHNLSHGYTVQSATGATHYAAIGFNTQSEKQCVLNPASIGNTQLCMKYRTQ